MSRRFQLDLRDLAKIATGGLVALAGAGLTVVSELVMQTNYGEWTPIVVAGWSVAANILRKALKKTVDDDETFNAAPTDEEDE